MLRTRLLFSFFSALTFNAAFAQTTGTYVVTDNTNRVFSCQDTSITLQTIYERAGIRDLDDPSDNAGNYRMLRLNGSLITSDIIAGPIKYTDYASVYVEKFGTTFNGHNGVVIYLGLIQRPTSLFKKDSLVYTVEKGAKVNYTKDMFDNFTFYSNGFDVKSLEQRFTFIDEANQINTPMTGASHWEVGKGNYKVKLDVAVCSASDLFWDSLAVIVKESPCSNVAIKSLPSVCLTDQIDIRDHVYVDGAKASASQLANMTFWDRSSLTNANAGAELDPSNIHIAQMFSKTDRSPNMVVKYQPNVDLGTSVCLDYGYRFTTKIPTKFVFTDAVFLRDNADRFVQYQIDGIYYGFNNEFKKDVLNKRYLDYYQVFAGTTFRYFTDATFTTEVTGSTLSPGNYTVLATNSNCSEDSSTFAIQVKNRDFDIQWKSAANQGKGYYTFTADDYPGATYSWFVWGGSIVAGLGTKEVTVYFSQNMASAVTVQCTINLPVSTRMEAGTTTIGSALYTQVNASQAIGDFVTSIQTENKASGFTSSFVYPNPANQSFAVSGNGSYDLKVYNALGQLEYADRSYVANSPIQLENKGMYIVHLSQQNSKQILKVMLQ